MAILSFGSKVSKYDDILERSQQAIAQGALTNSKHPKSFVFGVYPTHVQHGQGCFLYDTSGRKYTDFICGLGANLLGYGNIAVADAVRAVLYRGWSHSLPTIFEVEAVETLKKLFPFVERVKFLKTGTEACMAAVRIARSTTGRKKIISEGYHGWSDGFVSLVPPASGVPEDPNIKPFTSLEDIDAETAGVIVEPVSVDFSPERKAWLESLRETCTRHGAMLIFDEVITGFRFLEFSVARAWDVVPDLICLGKAIANGMPLSCVAGKAGVMDPRDYFVSSTYAGEILSLSACKKVGELLLKKQDYRIDDLWSKGTYFKDQFNAIAPDIVKITGYPTRGVFEGTPESIALFFQEAAKAGILFCKSWFFNWALSEQTTPVLNACRDILGRISRDEIKLEGEMPVSPFSAKVRGLADDGRKKD